MKDSYYYRNGQQIPVRVLESARVLKDPGERVGPLSTGRPTVPLEDDLVLEVSPELLEERSAARGLGALSRRLLDHERQATAERSLDALVPEPVLPGVAAFPVVADAEEAGLLFASGDVVAQLHPSQNRTWLEETAGPQGWHITRELSFAPNGYLLSPEGSADPLAFANRLVEDHGVASAHPVFLEEIEEREALPTEPVEPEAPAFEVPASATLFGSQWHLRALDAPNAWRITRGRWEITLAVIDSGVETGHETFRGEGKLAPGFNFASNTADPRPDTSSHGTSCAAVAAAAWEGGQVLGVAPDCRILPIRRSQLGNHLKLAESIAWAVDHEADILSCSFGLDGRPWVLPDVVRLAFEHAATRGRGGLGCPIFWAAGNGNEPVSSDEWASSDRVIAVAASTDQTTRAPYSDFGPEIDVCAPSSGGVEGVVTAANQGYTNRFGGTSAAAPMAAGVAALVLSVAPHLRASEVRDLLVQSARKIDPGRGGYDERGHSPLYGFGQVDAFAALRAVDAAEEAARAAGAETLPPEIGALARFLRASRRGRPVLTAFAARRFGFLEALRSSAELREVVARLLPVLADLGGKLQAGEALSLSEDAWNDVEQVVQALRAIPPLADLGEITNPNDLLEVPMNGNGSVQTFEAAVEQLAGLFETGERDATPPPPVSEAARKRLEEKGRVARQELYLRGMPVITKEKAQQLELELPDIVRLLKVLRRRPALRQQILEQASQAMRQLQSTPGAELDERLRALGQMIEQDLTVEGERVVVAVIGVGVAIYMAGYTIVKNWGV